MDIEALRNGARSGFAEDDRNAVLLRRPFQARGEVHRVAEHGIVVAPARSDVSDDAGSCIDADTDGEPRNLSIGAPRTVDEIEAWMRGDG